MLKTMTATYNYFMISLIVHVLFSPFIIYEHVVAYKFQSAANSNIGSQLSHV